MHDWNEYVTWENRTVYTRTYVVNQKHPKASDTNEGTKERPMLTINAAAQKVQAGEKVLIHGGVYREMIEPRHPGAGPDRMISYEAANGEEVVVKGSRILKEKWTQNRLWTEPTTDIVFDYTWSLNVWMTRVPDSLFEKGYLPFQLPNVEPQEFDLMPWAVPVKNNVPFILPRGMLFQDGRRMIQLSSFWELGRLPGSFWVDRQRNRLHIHPFGSGNPNDSLFEVATQSHLLKPQSIGMGYIQVKGLTFEHCANGFLRASTGAVNALGGHHWIFESNTIRQVNSSGLEFGYRAYETRDPRPQNIPRNDEDLGGVIVRNNKIHDCGTAGIRCLTVTNGLVENNEIWNCGWQDAEQYWECSGIKLLVTKNTIVRGNHVHHLHAASGIWLDYNNKHSRVTGNIIHDVNSVHGGIFLEASRMPNLIDHNIIWNINGNGIFGNDSDNQLYCHNLIGKITGAGVYAVVATDRVFDGRKMTADKNRVLNNLFIECGERMVMPGMDNVVDHNVYVEKDQTVQPTKKEVASGYDKHSQNIIGKILFRPDVLLFKWNLTSKVEQVPALGEVDSDYFNVPREDRMTFPGPFSTLTCHMELMIKEKFHVSGVDPL